MRGHDYMSEIAGELWVDNPDIPVTSAEQVKDYNQVDPTTNKPKTIEQLNTEFKTAIQALENATGNTTLVSRVNNLWNLLGTEEDVDNVINKFNEVVAFLDGIEETDRLNSLLDAIRTLINAKANKNELYVEQGYGANADKVTIILGEGIGKSATVLKEHQDISGKANTADLATVATSGDYNDLTNKPTIPSLNGYATKAWVGEQGFLTAHQDISGKVDKVTGKGLSTNDYTTEEKTKLGALPTNSDLQTALSGKQNTISDLSTIRNGAAAGATAVQPADIAALDATESGTSTDGKVSVEVTETDGVVTGVEVTTNDIASASALNAEVARAQGVEANKANAADVYTKQEVNGLVSTPHQNYVTVADYASLPSSGQATDTIYRVSNYDGTQVDTTKYAEYAWNGTQYVLLSVKSAVGEVFDISDYNSGSIYNTLSDALGTNGTNVPVNNRKGGMSIKFIKRLNYDLYSVTVETDTNNAQLDGWSTATTIEHELVDGTDLVAEAIVANLDTTVTNDHSEKGDVLAAIQALNLNGTAKFAYTIIETIEGDGDIPLQRTYYYLYTVTKTTNETTEYVQYRLMSTAWSIATSDWQGVDAKPTAGSDNLVKSGGVDKELEDYKLRVYGLSALPAYNGSVDGDGKIVSNYPQARNKVVQVNGGETMTIKKGSNISRVAILRSYDYNRTIPYTFDYATGTEMLFPLGNSSLITKELPSDARYIIFNVKNSSGDDCTPSVLTLNGIDLLKGLEDKTAFASGENVSDVNIVDSIESNNNGLPKSSSVYAANVNVKKETEMLVLDDATSLEGQIVGIATDFDFDSLKITRFINASASHKLIIVASVNDSNKEFTLLNNTDSGYYTGVKTYSKTREDTGTIKVVVRFNGKSYAYNSTELLINKSLVDRYDALDDKLESEITRATGIEGGLQTALTTISGKVDDLENAVAETEQISYNSTSTGDGVTQVDGYCRVDNEPPRIVSSDRFHVIKFPVQNGDRIVTNTSWGSGVWGHILYDSSNTYLDTIRPTDGVFIVNNENAAYIAITWKLADVSLNEISAVLYRKTPLSDTVEELDSRVEYIENYINDVPVNHAYKGTAPAGIRNKLLNMSDDVNILLLGDSMTAFTNVGPVFENAANLPAGCQRDTFTYQLWDAICKNKPQCDRFDSAVNAFTETGTWALSNVAKQNTSVNSNTDKGEFSSDNCVYHETAVTNDSVAFSWNLDDYEKLNFIYRISAYDGTTEVTISCTSGKVVVYDRASNQWVEANGYTFSQTKTAGTSKSDGVADWLRNIPLKMKRVANATGSVTLTFTNTGTGTMYYWGTERYNFNTVRITNIARGGRHIQLLQGNIGDEISYRDIDLIICQLPLWNELKAGGDYNATWDTRHIAFLDYLKSRSSNFADWQVIVNLYHTQVNDWIGNKNIQFQANGDTTRPKTTLPSWDCEMKTIAALDGYDTNVSVCNLVNEMYNFAQSHDTTMQRILTAESQMSSSTEVDENAVGDFFTVDGVHLSQLGFKFYAMCIVPMLYK